MEIASYPFGRIQFRYRSTGRLRDLPGLHTGLVVEAELKYKALILQSAQHRAMDSFLVVITQ